MALDPVGPGTQVSPTSSGRSSPAPRAAKRAVEEGIYKADKALRRYGANIERALGSWEISPQEWADYIAFLGRLLKAIQSLPQDAPLLPHSDDIAYKLAQCLNPALPSGVHQKALEVYDYIFSTFGQTYVSDHLPEFLPGLSAVLSFGSLSVRPAFYSMYEKYILRLSADDLRPVLRSLILSLLPGLEDETSEDFEQAFGILEGLMQLFGQWNPEAPGTTESDGFFWQCLFLAMISNASRRQGALNFLTRKLPHFRPTDGKSNADSSKLSDVASAVVTPEPGLLVRCFVCGLSDPQILIQRGFLDLLVANVPLNSPLFEDHVRANDLDLLVSAASHVLLRREMSLNRRLWSWFLGPQPKSDGMENPQHNEADDKDHGVDALEATQFAYFTTYGKESLERCILAMFRRNTLSALDRARPFRICLSLMDRWEIGGSIVPNIFRPAMDSAFRYSLKASPQEVGEVMRSASLFFDGVEASLIWADSISLLETSVAAKNGVDDLQMFKWITQTFNVKDEEMLLVHIPYALTYLLVLLQEVPSDPDNETAALDIVTILLDIIPDRAFTSAKKGTAINGISAKPLDSESVRKRLKGWYQAPEQSQALPYSGAVLSDLMLRLSFSLLARTVQSQAETLFCRVVSILLTLNAKMPSFSNSIRADASSAVISIMKITETEGRLLAFPTLSAIVSLSVALGPSQREPAFLKKPDVIGLEPSLFKQLWDQLSPTQPKYHVEAVKAIWQLHDVLAPDDCLQSSLTTLVRRWEYDSQVSPSTFFETLQRFSVLWSHTVPASTSTAPRLPRRASGTTGVVESKISKHRQQILIEPVMIILDLLNETHGETVDTVNAWLRQLPTLPSIFGIHFEMLTESMQSTRSKDELGNPPSRRHRADSTRLLEYVLDHFRDILRDGDEWIWQCFENASVPVVHDEPTTALPLLATCCCNILSDNSYAKSRLEQKAIDLLHLLLSCSSAATLGSLEIDSRLTSRLIEWLSENRSEQQDSLLRLLTLALKIRSSGHGPAEPRPESSANSRKASGPTSTVTLDTSNSASTITPPEQLLQCLRLGFSSRSSRPHLNQWLAFLSNSLIMFPDTIFASLIPLVETLCAELHKAHAEVQSLAKVNGGRPFGNPEPAIAVLMDILEALLSRAHDELKDDVGADSTPKPPTQPRSLLGNVTTGIFKGEGASNKPAQTNSRLNVVLAFQDAVRVSFKLWTWASQYSGEGDFDKSSAATTSYNALRIRNRTRHFLEQTFLVEPLESLEVIISIWSNSSDSSQSSAALDLLHVTHGMRPRAVVSATLDALYSRTNTSGLPIARQSCQTTSLTALDVTLFWSAYLQSIEDDAMDEIWADCMVFFKDVLSNPLPYRQALAALLSIVMLMAEKVENTNFGEQRKMRRDLGDTFLRLLAATFAALPSGSLESNGTESSATQKSISLVVVLERAIENTESLLETADRSNSLVNSVSASLIAPVLHSKSFPNNITPDFLALLLQLSKKAPNAKSWKKELNDAFNDPKLLQTSTQQMSTNWFPILRQWSLHDKERLPDLLSRLTPPTSAGIMFGVGASAARFEADRKTQLNLRRLCLILLASTEDTFVSHLRPIEEKLVELFEASPSSSPSSAIKSDLFMVCRTLVLSVSATNLAPLWPLFNNTMHAALMSLMPAATGASSFTNLSLLQACKLLDLLVAAAPDDFQLHEWLYVSDTIDAVYQPANWTPASLSDQIAENLNAEQQEDSANALAETAISSATAGKRRPLLKNPSLPSKDDIKAMTKDDFARVVLLPFFSQLSIHTYEGYYSMEVSDLSVSRQSLLEDILDLSTIVE